MAEVTATEWILGICGAVGLLVVYFGCLFPAVFYLIEIATHNIEISISAITPEHTHKKKRALKKSTVEYNGG